VYFLKKLLKTFGVECFDNYFRHRNEISNKTYNHCKEDFPRRGSCLMFVCWTI